MPRKSTSGRTWNASNRPSPPPPRTSLNHPSPSPPTPPQQPSSFVRRPISIAYKTPCRKYLSAFNSTRPTINQHLLLIVIIISTSGCFTLLKSILFMFVWHSLALSARESSLSLFYNWEFCFYLVILCIWWFSVVVSYNSCLISLSGKFSLDIHKS